MFVISLVCFFDLINNLSPKCNICLLRGHLRSRSKTRILVTSKVRVFDPRVRHVTTSPSIFLSLYIKESIALGGQRRVKLSEAAAQVAKIWRTQMRSSLSSPSL